MNLTLTDSDPDRDPECWMLTIRNDYDSDTTDGHVCIDTMANIHLIDQQYFPYGYDTNGARPIKGVKKNATTYSLGTGDPVLHVKIAGRAYALTLRGAHAADAPARNIISYSELTKQESEVSLTSTANALTLTIGGQRLLFRSMNGLFMAPLLACRVERDVQTGHRTAKQHVAGPPWNRPGALDGHPRNGGRRHGHDGGIRPDPAPRDRRAPERTWRLAPPRWGSTRSPQQSVPLAMDGQEDRTSRPAPPRRPT